MGEALAAKRRQASLCRGEPFADRIRARQLLEEVVQQSRASGDHIAESETRLSLAEMDFEDFQVKPPPGRDFTPLAKTFAEVGEMFAQAGHAFGEAKTALVFGQRGPKRVWR
jgi:hypothetical protein